MRRTRKLLRIPATNMKPRHTATTVWPVRLSPPGLLDAGESHGVEASVLWMEPERELSVVLKLQPRVWTTISGSIEQSAGEEVDTRSKSRTALLLFPTRWEGQYNTVLRVWGELSVPCALLYTSSSIMYVNYLHRLLSSTFSSYYNKSFNGLCKYSKSLKYIQYCFAGCQCNAIQGVVLSSFCHTELHWILGFFICRYSPY